MKLNLIYCKNNQNYIGINNDLLFNIKDDIKHFKKTTTQEYIKDQKNIVIMGYNTWLSIPEDYKPLKNRINIVISKNHFNELKEDKREFLVYKDFKTCYDFLSTEEFKGNMLGKKFIIGGSQLYNYVYENYYEQIDIIYETNINCSLPQIDYKPFSELNFTISTDKYFKKLTSRYIDSEEIKPNSLFEEYIEWHTLKIPTLSYHGVNFNIYQKELNINKDENQYLELMKDILYKNNIKDSRNSKVISQFGEKMKFDLRKGFPLLTTKRMPFKTILRELLWFISGCTDNDILNKNKVHIWDQNGSKEFLESRGLPYEENDLGPVYGFQWRHFGAKYFDRYSDYTGKGEDQLQNVINLIKTDPTSRRIILSAWNASDLDKMALPPCHVMVQFSIDKEFIDAQLYQRSGDMFLGVPFNIASYALLLHIVGSITDYKPRYLHHVLGDSHIYFNHIDSIGEQIFRIPLEFPKLLLKEKITDIDNIDENNFVLKGYNHYPTIKADMIA